ncbi:MAG: hypothetical protein ACJAXB_002302 [Candidatus Endobugula sp.]|jgi:hypothetical protein
MAIPDFLCIGAQKSGTTWLYHQFRKHPQIWLTPVKELHYFDKPHINRYINHIHQRNQLGRFVRSLLKKFLLSSNSGWMIHFIIGFRNDQYYTSLFRPKHNQISGEITPAYGKLDINAIQNIASLIPEAKIIYLLRNPVDRIWSAMNNYKRTRSDLKEISIQQILDKKGDILFDHSNYFANLQRWMACYSSDQLFIGFFEEIELRPQQLLYSIYEFLEIETEVANSQPNTQEPRNRGEYQEMPRDLEKYLTSKMISEMEKLHKHFNNVYTLEWMNRATKVLNS